MHFAIVCLAVATLLVSCKHQHGPAKKLGDDIDYEYTQYDFELAEPAKPMRRTVRKVPNRKVYVTHRKLEIIVTEPTTPKSTTEDRQLRYNEKVYLPHYQLKKNTTHSVHELFGNNVSVHSMLPRLYSKQEWNSICFPLTGTSHPDGPLDYFEAIQAMRPPHYFSSVDNEPPFVKFFAEGRYLAVDSSRLKKALTRFLRCLFSVISHVPEHAKRKKITKTLFASIIGWLKDSLLVELYVLQDRPEQSIVEIEQIVQALVHMRNKHYVPDVTPEALKTYEFISADEQDAGWREERRGFRLTTAIMVTTGVSLLFLLATLGACVAAAAGRLSLQQVQQLPEAYLPLDVRPSQLLDGTDRVTSLMTASTSGHTATPAGYEQQVRKLSVIPESNLAAKARRTSMQADQEEQLSPLLDTGASNDTTAFE